ncbi:MAG: hypothetical protein JWR42_1846 [Marmoricola sp.]|nr:hypothetical protein [Marmoricola sp.]
MLLDTHPPLSGTIGAMDTALDPALGGEGADVHRIRSQSDDIVDVVSRAAREGHDRVRRVVGLQELVKVLRQLEPATSRSSRVIQPAYAYDPEDPGVRLTQDARHRGVVTRIITRPATVRTHPLLSSIFPETLLGPCFLRSMVVDGRTALVGGPDDVEGNRTSFLTTLPEVVEGLGDLWSATVPLCRPILEPGQRPPLTERQLEVARLLCVGEKDKAIARLLRLSPRTVEREVSAILAGLAVGSRTEAVLAMRGRGVNGGGYAGA